MPNIPYFCIGSPIAFGASISGLAVADMALGQWYMMGGAYRIELANVGYSNARPKGITPVTVGRPLDDNGGFDPDAYDTYTDASGGKLKLHRHPFAPLGELPLGSFFRPFNTRWCVSQEVAASGWQPVSVEEKGSLVFQSYTANGDAFSGYKRIDWNADAEAAFLSFINFPTPRRFIMKTQLPDSAPLAMRNSNVLLFDTDGQSQYALGVGGTALSAALALNTIPEREGNVFTFAWKLSCDTLNPSISTADSRITGTPITPVSPLDIISMEWEIAGSIQSQFTPVTRILPYPYEGRGYSCVASFPFSGNIPTIRCRFNTNYGLNSSWSTFKFAPVPYYGIESQDDDSINLSASQSFSPDDVLTDLTVSSNISVAWPSDGKFSYDTSPFQESLEASGVESSTFGLELVAWDSRFRPTLTQRATKVATYTRNVTVNANGTRSDALTDQQGAMFTAVNRKENVATQTTAGVQITRHHVDNNGRYVGFNLQGVPNLQNPTLMQHPGTHALYLFAQNRTTKVWQLWGSDDWGEEFTLMANSPMDTNYKVVPCALDSGFALAGVKKTTTPPEIWFALTWDGVTYDAIAGGTGTGQTLKLVGSKTGAKTVAIHQENLVNSARLVVIVDGTPFKFSEDFGDSWEDAAV